MHDLSTPTTRRAEAWAMLAAAVFPALAAWLYFVELKGSATAIQQTAYAAGKILQFGFPVVWLLVRRERPRWARPKAAGVLQGIAFGAAVLVVMLAGYHAWLQPSGLLAKAGRIIADKVSGFGVDSPVKYVALGVFYCAVHSLLEEYYWRWFLFGGLRRLLPLGPAIVLASVAFMGHHVIVLATYFGWCSWQTWLLSLCVAVGGAAWCWIYHRSQSLVGPWLSHLLVDAAIFIIGYDLLKPSFGW
jgi:membrane protease YdiL (CAAX protease family)